VFLSVTLTVSLFVCLPVCMSLCVSVCVSQCVFVSVCVSLSEGISSIIKEGKLCCFMTLYYSRYFECLLLIFTNINNLCLANLLLLLLLLSHFSRVWLCVTRQTVAHQAPSSLGFSRQEHWSGLPFPSPMHESEKWKWKCTYSTIHPWIILYFTLLNNIIYQG